MKAKKEQLEYLKKLIKLDEEAGMYDGKEEYHPDSAYGQWMKRMNGEK